jgi:hypothetical protein
MVIPCLDEIVIGTYNIDKVSPKYDKEALRELMKDEIEIYKKKSKEKGMAQGGGYSEHA